MNLRDKVSPCANSICIYLIIKFFLFTSDYQSSLVPEWTHPELSLVSYGVLPVYRTVEDFNQLKTNDKEILTDPFYTAQGGYKMTMKFIPNYGHGEFKRTHLFVGILLMRGENDHKLSFPINGMFRIKLLNWRQTKDTLKRLCSLMNPSQRESDYK